MNNNNQCMPVNELIARLKMDSALSVLFVEGLRDLSFWRKYAPIGNRRNSVVYASNLLSIPDKYDGGEKGKLLKLVEILEGQDIFNRVKIFIDADNDRLLDKGHPSNVVMTDYRDLESYAFNEKALAEVVFTGLAKNEINIHALKERIEELSMPIANLRLLSEKYKYFLAFADTFKEHRRKKYIKKREGTYVLDIEALINSLLQNTGISLAKNKEIHEKLIKVTQQSKNIDVRQMLHGKDWSFFLAYCCNVDPDAIEPLIFLGIDYDALDTHHNILSVKRYLFGQMAN